VWRTARLQAAFVRACERRLEATEAALYEETVTARIDALNRERVEILAQIATPERLPLLMHRRFQYWIHDEVRKIIDRVIALAGEPPEEARSAWEILREDGDESAVARWWRHVCEGSGLDVLAAAHRLAALGKALNPEPLRALLAMDLDSARLAAIAELCGAAANAELVDPIEKLARSLVESVEGVVEVEAFTRLVAVFMSLDAAQGRRLAGLVDMVSMVRREAETRPGHHPWRRLSSRFTLDAEDCDALLSRGGADAKAAIFAMSGYGGGAVCVAEPVSSPTKCTEESLERFRKIAEQESELEWQFRIALASTELQATGLLPKLLTWANRPELASLECKISHSQFGQYYERRIAAVLRAIGYLARLLLDSDHPADATDAVAFLHARATTLADAEDRSIVVGCTTALGYLGEWEPILTHLGPGEPWMDEAADNVFKHWVSKDLTERERAARWIARRLRTHHDLEPEVRSTLGTLLERLEREIGRHVGAEEFT
jgi:hypothetical protein